MRKLLILFISLCLISCSGVSKKKVINEQNDNEIKLKEFYRLEIAWEEDKVYDVELNDEKILNGEEFKLKSSETHVIKWIVPSVSVEFSLSYEIGESKISSPNKETELSGKIGINFKQIKLTKDTYIYIDGTTLKILPLSNIAIPEEKKEKEEFDIFKTPNNQKIEIIDETENN